MVAETPTPLRLSLFLLGPFRATVGQEPLAESRSKKIEALLAYLALESDSAHRRENLVGLLFPELPDEQARTNLRQTLTRLRRAIHDQEASPQFLLVTRESTRFNPDSDHFVDVTAYEAFLLGCREHRGRRDGRCPECMHGAQQAVDLYRGPFLDGFFLEDSSAFDEWMLSQRERLQAGALAAAAQLASYYENRGDYPAAEREARRQISIEPWREEAHRQLMRLLAFQGRRGDALRQYERLAALLEDELGIEPNSATVRLQQQIAAANETRRHNLPPRDVSFVGRSLELATVNEYLADPDRRLVSLIGPGGSGKTALAVEAGWQVATRYLGPFMHGVFMVSLVGIDPPAKGEGLSDALHDPLVTATADALKFSLTRNPQRELLNYLNDKRLLLILDNAEHMVDAVRDLVLSLLRGTLMPKILVTSRARLNLADEWLVELGGLPVPDLALSPVDETSPVDDAPKLFVRRAQRLVPEIAVESDLSPCPRPTIIRICRLVQGLPLGVELAASWVRILSCQEIAAELENSLDFLRSSSHDLPERHQSLRAVFDYSWGLLNDSEREILRRLSIFAGTFDRPAAEAITGASVQRLARLVDYSLLQRRTIGVMHGQRYEFLDVLRHFAAEKLGDSNGGDELLRERHGHYYLDFLANRLEALRGGKQQSAVLEIAQEISNIRAAWKLASESADLPALAKAEESLAMFYYMRSWFAEGEASFAVASHHLGQESLDRDGEIVLARLLAWKGWFIYLAGRSMEGTALIQQSVAQLRRHDATMALGYCLPYLAVAIASTGDYDRAWQLAGEAQAICRQASDRYGLAVSANVLSQISYLQGDYNRARRFGQESLDLLRESGNLWSMAFSLTNLGRADFAAADYMRARAHYREAIDIRETLGDSRGKALGLLYLGDAAAAEGDYGSARVAYQQSLAIFRDIGSQSGAAGALARMGHIARREGQTDEAQQAYVEALQLAGESQAVRPMLDALRGLADLTAGDSPDQSLLAARLVAGHPATDEASRRAALAVMAKICEHIDVELTQPLSPEEAADRLDDVAQLMQRSVAAA